MVKLSGKVRIEFTDLSGRETRSPIEQNNLIFNQTLLDILSSEPKNVFYFNGGFTTIGILTDNTNPTPNNPNPTGELARGYVPNGATSPIWYESITPNFGQIQNRIDSVTVPRTFNSVGIVAGTKYLCRTLLTIPCTQNAFEVLNIYYQIQVENTTGQRLSARFTRDFGGKLFNAKNCYHYVLGTSYCDAPLSSYSYIDVQQDLGLTDLSARRQWNNNTIVSSHYKFKESSLFQIQQSGVSGATDEYIGWIFNSMLTGLSNQNQPSANFIAGSNTENTSSAYRISRYKTKTVNIDPTKPVFQPPFQKIWTHKSGLSVPFFDVSNAAIGSSYPTTSGTWTGRWPELYKFIITASGDIGSATYQFSKRLHLGFNGNAYSDRTVICPFRNPNTPAAVGMHGWKYEDNDLLRWSNTQIVQYDQTGVTLLDLMNGAYQNWDVGTTPALPVTTLRQVAVDPINGLIYCACRNTGLWVINVTTNTVSNVVGAYCYGVDVGQSGIAFAIFERSLRKSTDWSVSLSFTYAGLTDSYWSRAYFLKVDPTNNQIAIVIDSPNNPSNSRQVVWYDSGSAIATTGFDSSGVSQWAASLDVSDTGSFWAIYNYKLSFGNASTTSIATPPTQNINHSVWGQQNLYKIAFYNSFLIATGAIINSGNVSQNSYTSLGSSATVLHMQGGITLLSNALRQLFTDNSYCYENYGWNGSRWVLNGTGSKATHTDAQALIEGLQIAWVRGATPPYFQSGDFYTQGILNGTWKDNATTIYFENFYYTRPVYFDVAVPSSVTVPIGLTYTLPATSDPTFYLIETDSINELASFTLNGNPVPTIYVNGEAPGAGEVSVNGATGVVTFNAANQGHTFAGTYAWIGS
ncbi:hypothetical protein G7B40_001365 [Aetokthonos hydrillicola Thurmond2011]|uniref:Uncharacterized protein n=1 Tax=Aetokthonos hydrillicola Thurmond2011 TaxID=2712845 RepID=A0AAP5I1S5_9CYAN|nr:hypothetical protein [Aetokthonos hydrillicola]MBO3463112.1 hypothetical protein [Aetokthonos hydrillicola CCALA 1050]MBW4591104.1 hypothetical protein [Aetokthonos hydrillicola CCALA 1050]MDR9893234.1 hypothetical protein [Aetokthonos hydrillicola Thurmond2011]